MFLVLGLLRNGSGVALELGSVGGLGERGIAFVTGVVLLILVRLFFVLRIIVLLYILSLSLIRVLRLKNWVSILVKVLAKSNSKIKTHIHLRNDLPCQVVYYLGHLLSLIAALAYSPSQLSETVGGAPGVDVLVFVNDC